MPLDEFSNAVNKVLNDEKFRAFQYGPGQGNPKLISWISSHHGVDENQVLITSGSQQSLDLISKVFLDPGDSVVVETPTYTGALDTFSWYRAQLISPEHIADVPVGNHKLVYVEPTYQNPTGRSWSEEQRKSFIEKILCTDSFVIEDAAYADIWFENPIPSLRDRCPDRVIYLGSFSKVLNPGMRLSYIIAPTVIIDKLVQVKKITDMASSYFLQEVAYETLSNGKYESHMRRIRRVYQHKRNLLVSSLNESCPEIQFAVPAGGFFLWITTPNQSFRVRELALEKKVSVTPGVIFYAHNSESCTTRLSYVKISDDNIEKVVDALSYASKS
jgi:2-aminoadipate transaminase